MPRYSTSHGGLAPATALSSHQLTLFQSLAACAGFRCRHIFISAFKSTTSNTICHEHQYWPSLNRWSMSSQDRHCWHGYWSVPKEMMVFDFTLVRQPPNPTLSGGKHFLKHFMLHCLFSKTKIFYIPVPTIKTRWYCFLISLSYAFSHWFSTCWNFVESSTYTHTRLEKKNAASFFSEYLTYFSNKIFWLFRLSATTVSSHFPTLLHILS